MTHYRAQSYYAFDAFFGLTVAPLQAARDHLVEGCHVFLRAQGQPAVDLHERVEPGAPDGQGRHRRHSPWILGQFPFTAEAPADDLAEVAAPQACLELQIFGRLAVEYLFQHIDRRFTAVQALAMFVPG